MTCWEVAYRREAPWVVFYTTGNELLLAAPITGRDWSWAAEPGAEDAPRTDVSPWSRDKRSPTAGCRAAGANAQHSLTAVQ
jgi:hypothetical protein